ncbi:MAG: helix-turn-helix domain-containing protein [Desulfitobacteriaceae bacterium]|nr:helix-turn-helix domain-containing protein [Desulfitobacteriaceae bacterium]
MLSAYDEGKTFEENLNTRLCYDSIFYRFLPELLRESFRTSETYHAILYSISRGHHRISEIGNDLGFPYNKCDKYIDALRKLGLVEARQEDSKRSTYHITNSYINFWYHNLYENKDRITPSPSKEFTDAILERLDGEYTFPCYHDACQMWLKKRGSPLHASPIFSELGGCKGEPLTVKLENGEAFTFEYSDRQGENLLLAKFQSDFDTRYDKALFLKTIAAAEKANTFYNTAIAIFSTNRFSDYCVHAVSKMDNVLLIPIIQLK